MKRFLLSPVNLSLLLFVFFCSFSCDNGPKPNKAQDSVITTPETNPEPAAGEDCLNACFIKDSYYQIQMNRLEYEYQKAPELQSPIYDTLLAITKDLMLKCNCRTLNNCPACLGRGTECCIPPECSYEDCVQFRINRPECFRSQYPIDFFYIIDKDEVILAKADTGNASTDVNGDYVYPIIYEPLPIPENTTIEFKESNYNITYSVSGKGI